MIPGQSTIAESNALRWSTFSCDRSFARTIFERGVDGGRIKMSIRCAFRSLVSVIQLAPPFRLLTVPRARPPTRPKIAPFRSRAPTRSRSPLSSCFFRCLEAPPRTGNTPPKDNYNKNRLHNTPVYVCTYIEVDIEISCVTQCFVILFSSRFFLL